MTQFYVHITSTFFQTIAFPRVQLVGYFLHHCIPWAYGLHFQHMYLSWKRKCSTNWEFGHFSFFHYSAILNRWSRDYIVTCMLLFLLIHKLIVFLLQNGDTGLHISSALKRRKITKLLIESAVDVNVRNKVRFFYGSYSALLIVSFIYRRLLLYVSTITSRNQQSLIQGSLWYVETWNYLGVANFIFL